MKRHPLDVFSLFAGLLFTGLGVAFLLDALDQWSADLGWVPPIVLIVLGLGGVASTMRRDPRPATADGTDVDSDHAPLGVDSTAPGDAALVTEPGPAGE